MGLLDKAGSLDNAEAAQSKPLDETGKTLKERIKRLPEKKSTPYTALSLLKSYGGFQTGICLSLKDGFYSSYTSVGFGVEKLSLQCDELWSRVKARNKYFKLNSEKNLGLENSPKDLVYWVFPLDTLTTSPREPWKAVVLLGSLESSDFNPNVISAMLDGTADKMILPEDKETEQIAVEPIPSDAPSDELDIGGITFSEDMPGEVISGEINLDDMSLVKEMLNEEISNELSFSNTESGSIGKEIALFQQSHPEFNGIILENPPLNNSDDDFCKTVSAIIDKAGSVIPLPSGRPLILLPLAADRQLIAHRLSKTLNAKNLLSFEANNPESALTLINPLL